MAGTTRAVRPGHRFKAHSDQVLVLEQLVHAGRLKPDSLEHLLQVGEAAQSVPGRRVA